MSRRAYNSASAPDRTTDASTERIPDQRERILHAAAECFARTGYHGTGVRAIATQADVNIAMVSYYFGGKPGLLQALYEHVFGTMRDALTSALADEPLPAEGVPTLIAACAETQSGPAQAAPAQPDLPQLDLSQPDLSQPDLSQPDLSQPDLSQPDLSQPDLSQPDLSQLCPAQAEPAQSGLSRTETVQLTPAQAAFLRRRFALVAETIVRVFRAEPTLVLAVVRELFMDHPTLNAIKAEHLRSLFPVVYGPLLPKAEELFDGKRVPRLLHNGVRLDIAGPALAAITFSHFLFRPAIGPLTGLVYDETFFEEYVQTVPRLLLHGILGGTDER